MSTPNNHSDVIVIGAGFAGVAAARDLTRAGLNVNVLEARDRIGGRTWTKPSPLGHDLELGGAFVHWQQPHIWSEIVAHGLELQPVPALTEAYWIGPDGVRSGPPEATFELMAPTMEAMAVGAAIAFPTPHTPFPLNEAALAADMNTIPEMLDGLDLTEEQRIFANSFLGIAFSGNPEDGTLSQMQRLIALAGGSWAVFLQAMSAFTLKTGTKSLIEAMHAESSATTHLSTPVTRLQNTPDGVTATAADGRVFTARRAIVTIPLNVLDSAIEFVPPLSAPKRAAIDTGQVSKGVKVWMRAKGKLDPFIAFAPLPNPLCMAGYEYDVDGDTILLGFGADADLLDVTDLQQVQDAMRVWRPDIELVAVDAQDWTHDPYAGETWAMFGPRYLTEHAEAFLTPEDNVWIAGGDYSQAWAGHIDGAIESGRRVAAVIRTELATS